MNDVLLFKCPFPGPKGNDAGIISDYRTPKYEMIIEQLIEKGVEEHDYGRLGVNIKMSGTDCMMGGWMYK